MTTGVDNSAGQAASSPHVTCVEQVRSKYDGKYRGKKDQSTMLSNPTETTVKCQILAS